MKTVFETDRLFLREFMDSDYYELCEILQDKDVMYSYEHPFSDEEVKSWYNRLIIEHWTCSLTRLVIEQVLQNAPHFAVF